MFNNLAVYLVTFLPESLNILSHLIDNVFWSVSKSTHLLWVHSNFVCQKPHFNTITTTDYSKRPLKRAAAPIPAESNHSDTYLLLGDELHSCASLQSVIAHLSLRGFLPYNLSPQISSEDIFIICVHFSISLSTTQTLYGSQNMRLVRRAWVVKILFDKLCDI